MTSPATPSSSHPPGDDRNLVAVDESYVAPTFEDKLHRFWAKNRGLVLGVCVLILLGIIAKGGWDYLQAQKEEGVEKDFAAATTADQRKSFATAHPDHPLGGIAWLRIADEAYAAGKSAEAITAYDQAVTALKDKALVARALFGRAAAKIQGGKSAEGTAELNQLANDTTQFKGIRAAAAYQLTSLAADSGNAADVQKYAQLVMQIDPASQWMQPAMMLRASMPVPAPVSAPTATPAATKAATPGVQLKLPAK